MIERLLINEKTQKTFPETNVLTDIYIYIYIYEYAYMFVYMHLSLYIYIYMNIYI